MRKLCLFAAICCVVGATSAQAYLIGVSSHPFTMKTRFITAEVLGQTSDDGALGVQAKYFHKINSKVNVEGGVGITSGGVENRIFGGLEYLAFPEYGMQPRISAKAMLESADEGSSRQVLFGAAPTVSKSFSISKQEIFPFISLPMRLRLDGDSNTYETVSSLAIGATSNLPLFGRKDLVFNVEGNINLRNSYTTFVAGVAFPLR